ncbi:MAG TPA: hypothetical protein VL985_05065 [Stellaceae bacterium]|nr:hypothetical protein [Stellaceae bacterium]
MPEYPERHCKLGIDDRSVGDWRRLAAAWLVVIMFAMVFAAADALASLHGTHSSGETGIAGAVIPRHDPSFPGPDEIAASDWLERARAEAYCGW